MILSQFRCWSYREFELDAPFVYVCGPNGSGKTSLLEAVGFLSTGRSFRGGDDAECVHWGREGFSLRAETDGTVQGVDVSSLALAYRSSRKEGPRKVARLNDDVLSRLSDLRRYFPTVVFSPGDLRLIRGGPRNRRRFLNDLLSHMNPDYLEAYREYEQARRQRNSLLKRSSPDELLLEQYEETMGETGAVIVQCRKDVVEPLEAYLRKHLRDVDSEMSRTLEIRYTPDVSEASCAEELSRLFRDERPRALERGHTTIGPHRDDWMIHLEGRPADRFASQGEVRSLLVGLKIAEASIIIKKCNNTPLLLLDDLESELDVDRRRRFLHRVREFPSQVLITGTRSPAPDASREADRIIRLKAG